MVLVLSRLLEARTRFRNRQQQDGAVYYRNVPGGTPSQVGGPFLYTTYAKEIQDFHKKARRFDGTLPPSDLSIMESEHKPCFVTCREYWNGQVSNEYINLPMTTTSNWNMSPIGGWQSIEPTQTELVAKLLARSNPFAYTVSVPIMLFELLEISSMLSVSGANAFASGGKAFLANEFGIQPFMADIRALHQITSAIEKKIIDLNRLIRRGGLRKKVFLGKKSQTDPLAYVTSWSTHQKVFYTSRVNTYTSKIWGTCRWRPNILAEIDVQKLTSVNNAIRIVLDLKRPDWSTIWEMIPFSWLVDYFLNVGDTLQALEKSTLVEPYDICIMRHRTCDAEIKFWHPGPGFLDERPTLPRTRSLEWEDGWMKYSHRVRTSNILPPNGVKSLLAYGFLNNSQATNLTALLLAFNRHRP